MKTKASIPPVLLAIAAVVFLAGCTSPIQSGSLVVPAQAYAKQHPKTVAIKTTGGEQSGSLGLIRVSDETLSVAIADSLRASQLFTAIVSLGDSDYILSATTILVDQPIFGGSFTVETEIVWSLTPKGASKPIWEKLVRASRTKSLSDAMIAVTRLRLATEAATQENIRLAMNEIATLNLQ